MKLQWKVSVLTLIPLFLLLGFNYWSFEVAGNEIESVRMNVLVPADNIADSLFKVRSFVAERGFLLNRAILNLVNGDRESALRLVSKREQLKLERNSELDVLADLYARFGSVNGQDVYEFRAKLQSLDAVDSSIQAEIISFSGADGEVELISQRSLREAAPLRDSLLSELDGLYNYERDVVQHTRVVVAELQDKARRLSIVGLIVSVGAFSLVILLVYSLFVSPVRRITEVIDDISKGHIDVDVDESALKRDDEIGDLARAFDRTIYSVKLAMRRTPKDDGKKKSNK